MDLFSTEAKLLAVSMQTLVVELCSMQVPLSAVIPVDIMGAVQAQLPLMIAAAVRDPTARPLRLVLTFILAVLMKLSVAKRISVRLAKTGEILYALLSM